MDDIKKNRISIQVSLSGYFFKLEGEGDEPRLSGWMSADRVFTTPEFQERYDEVRISLLTHKYTLVPEQFFNPEDARSLLKEVVRLGENDVVDYVPVPQFGAVLIYSNTIGESLSKVSSETVLDVDGGSSNILPEIFFILNDLQSCPDYNKIVATYKDGYLHLAIAQGRSLLLANSYKAVDFNTAEYFLFLALKTL